MNAHASNFWNSIQPLLAPSAIPSIAYEELVQVFREALRIGFLMLSQTAQYDFEYPTARPVTWFDERYVNSLTFSIRLYAFAFFLCLGFL